MSRLAHFNFHQLSPESEKIGMPVTLVLSPKLCVSPLFPYFISPLISEIEKREFLGSTSSLLTNNVNKLARRYFCDDINGGRSAASSSAAGGCCVVSAGYLSGTMMMLLLLMMRWLRACQNEGQDLQLKYWCNTGFRRHTNISSQQLDFKLIHKYDDTRV